MDELGVQIMLRGHDHYVAMRSRGEDGRLYSHDIVSNRLESSEDSHTITGARDDDHPDEVRPADTNAFAEAVENRELF